jgi:hypothetical protein
MRLIFATILIAIMASSAAKASSFVVLGEIKSADTPSIVVLGEKSPSIVAARAPDASSPSIERFGGENPVPRNFVTVSASVIAMIDAPQPVAFENVASIGDGGNHRHRESLPMVIRGGIVGDAFTSRSAPVSNGAATPRSQEQVSAPPSGGNGPAPKEPDAPEPDQRMPKSALPPAAAPTGRME